MANSTSAYCYSTDWFESQRPIWEDVLSRLQLFGRPNVSYLEVGVFEGSSLFWMLDHVLTHPSSHAWAVDPFFREVFESNRALCAGQHKLTKLQGESKDILRSLPQHSFDVIFIDGNHDLKSVMTDIAFSWDLLKHGGLLALDDYQLDSMLKVPSDLVPRKACEAFLVGYGEELEVLYEGYQLFIRKKPSRRNGAPCIFIGDYRYWFYERKLTDGHYNPIEITGSERDLLAEYAAHLRVSYATEPDNPIAAMTEFQDLLRRLDAERPNRDSPVARCCRAVAARRGLASRVR